MIIFVIIAAIASAVVASPIAFGIWKIGKENIMGHFEGQDPYAFTPRFKGQHNPKFAAIATHAIAQIQTAGVRNIMWKFTDEASARAALAELNAEQESIAAATDAAEEKRKPTALEALIEKQGAEFRALREKQQAERDKLETQHIAQRDYINATRSTPTERFELVNL